jgi:transposase
MDAKAVVKLGDFSRGGKNRVVVKAADHDFKPEGTVTPVGILLPHWQQLFLFMVTSKVTSDCLVDILEQWWYSVSRHFSAVRVLVINLDNGPENSSRRTRFMERLVAFAAKAGLTIKLAYYPPYHSKYNPVERCWGDLEQHWNGDLLDTTETVVKFAESMTWHGRHPVVSLITKTYQTGLKLTKQAMLKLETQFQRLPLLENWFVTIEGAGRLEDT